MLRLWEREDGWQVLYQDPIKRGWVLIYSYDCYMSSIIERTGRHTRQTRAVIVQHQKIQSIEYLLLMYIQSLCLTHSITSISHLQPPTNPFACQEWHYVQVLHGINGTNFTFSSHFLYNARRGHVILLKPVELAPICTDKLLKLVERSNLF